MQMFTFIYLLSLLILPSLADDCFSCASPELEDNWEMTSFPLKPPKDLTFTDDCSTNTNTALKKACSSGVCYEAIIPFNKRVTYLRGCYSDFVDDTNFTRTNVVSGVCTYGDMGKDTVIDNSAKNPVLGEKPANAASRWCASINDGDLCNSVLVYSQDLFVNPANYFKKCINPPTGFGTAKTCKQCSHSSGQGDCTADTATTCRGNYCVKYEGYLNGDSVVVRTCAPTSPFSGDYCAWIESSSDFQLFGVSPSITLPYKANHCYCTGDTTTPCNPSTTVSSSLLISLVLPLFISRFIPFVSS